MNDKIGKKHHTFWVLWCVFMVVSLEVPAQSRINIPSQRTTPNSSIQSAHTLPPLSTVVWVSELSPRPGNADEKLYQELRERARIHLSGMIYGYEFTYTPLNTARGVLEDFEIAPLGQIAAENTITLFSSWRRRGQLYGQFNYRVPPRALQWLNSWVNSPTVTVGGRANIGLWEYSDAQNQVLMLALQDAVKKYVDRKYPTIPRRVYGRLLIRDGPRIWIDNNAYFGEIFTRIRVSAVDNY